MAVTSTTSAVAAAAVVCSCGCDRAGHRRWGPDQYGGCSSCRDCREYKPGDTAVVEQRCACGALLSQHYADNGKMRGPRGCQDYHTECDRLCKHAPRLLAGRRTEGEITPARRSVARQTVYVEPAVLPARLLEAPLPAAEPAAPATEPVVVLEPPADAPTEVADPAPAPVEPPAPPAPAEPVPAATPRPVHRRPAATRRQTPTVSDDLAAATRTVVAAALDAYPAWYCGRCSQRRLDPGRCPACNGQLVPVHVVIVPRSVA